MRVHARICDNEKARLLVILGDLVSEGTRGEAASNALSTSVLSELEDGTLSEGAVRDDNNIAGVLDCYNDSGSDHQLLPSLGEVNDVQAIIASFPDVFLHSLIGVGGADVNLCGQHLLDVFLPEY